MFERQMMRLPARAVAMAVITAIIAPIIAAVYELKVGFDNLEQSSPDFEKTTASLKELNTEFASQAAAPIFDTILGAMEQLQGWLTKNKIHVDGLFASFGQLVDVGIKSLISIVTGNPDLFKMLGVSLSGVLAIAELLMLSVKAVFDTMGSLVTAAGKIDVIDGPKAFFKSLATAGSDFWDGWKKKGLETIDLTQQALDKAGANVLNITGDETTPTNNIPVNNRQTLAEQHKDFENELATIQEQTQAALDKIKRSVAEHLETHQEAAPQILSVLHQESLSVNSLVKHYQELARSSKEAFEAKDQNKVQEAQTGYATVGNHQGTAIGKERVTAEDQADAEILTSRKITADALQKVEEENAKAALSIIKKQVSDGLMTHQEGLAQEEALEAQRHFAAQGRIEAMPTTGSGDQARKDAAFYEETARNLNTVNGLLAQHTDALIKDLDAQLKAAEASNKSKEAYLESNLEIAKAADNKRAEITLTQQLTKLKMQDAEMDLQIAQAKAANTDTGSKANLDARAQIAALQERIQQLTQQQTRQKYSNSEIGQQQYQSDTGNGPSSVDRIMESFGVNMSQLSQDMSNANTATESFIIGLAGTIPALANVVTAMGEFYNQLKKGNVLGALGGALSNKGVDSSIGSALGSAGGAVGGSIGGALSQIGSEMPMIGPAIGAIMSTVTNLFSQSIQNMVTDIQQQVAAINEQAATKQIGILQQITELKQEEQSAISSLGGKKKAKSELNSILTSLNDQIAQLQMQAQQTIQQFNDMVSASNTGNAAGNAVAQQWLQTWQGINQQVEAYIQAGGSTVVAAQYMNQQMQAQQQALTNQLNQGNQTAIADALQLNQLEQQKVDMMKQEAATEFGMLNSDSIERRTASAVSTGVALTNQRNSFALQMQTMNQQIALEQGRVTAESQVFDLNQSIAALQNEQNALNIAALQQQLESYKEMQAIITATSGMTFTPGSINPGAGLNGTQAPIPGMPGVTGQTVTNNITVNGNVTAENAATLGSEIASNIRSGRTTFSVAGS
jgi:hypothetical protein